MRVELYWTVHVRFCEWQSRLESNKTLLQLIAQCLHKGIHIKVDGQSKMFLNANKVGKINGTQEMF